MTTELKRNWTAACGLVLVLVGAGAGLAAAPATKSAVADDNLLWSFDPIANPPAPVVKDATWPRSDVDRFVLAKLEAANLKPSGDADRTTLIRRVAFDLTGLPATIADIDAFLQDKSPDDVAFARVVDRYLASPRFGERWGRNWLDVVHYADSGGRSWNAPFTYAFRYRDYVIDAFNKDKPYNQFIREQIAGDLLPATSVDQQREFRTATGLLALSPADVQEGDHEQFVLDRVDDQIDVTSRAFLGLTISCARCHDHKYDPISMRDYYAVAGVFYSSRTLSGQGAHSERNLDYVDFQSLVRLPVAKGQSAAVPSGVHSMSDFQAEWRSGKRNIRFATDPNVAMGLTEGDLADCDIRLKGRPRDRAEAPPRGDVRIPGLPQWRKVPANASGRLELADWIVSPQNPLTARVMVNRIWQHLFGRGLVRTVDDFGTTGESPTHPELLDHLASRFVAGGWSVKGLIRSLVLSRTYRQASAVPLGSANRNRDPQNELFWKMSIRRLEIEAIRDSMLLAAGRLDFSRPEGIQVAGIGGKARGASTYSLLGVNASCRTVYLPVLRSLLPELFTTFDFPDPSQILGQREVTTVGLQALFFMNSDFATGCAQDAAEVLLANRSMKEADRVVLAYRHLVGRVPSAEELKDATSLLAELRAAARPTDQYVWTVLTQGLMATAEFRYVR
ncbi:DUF1549 and DUF1553 domain-containing protein [Humisphaera borealis]|uniref:DUF1553 domain-containing protein n=1 Tax=Humisphaera borealis TaxID=2807512 RepID=A0A7M2WRU3_9BACT|nr:DUF1549 and DUF1553 domain-containing protein [Humisphaera borealis]QOV88237.1 DUF1553 domain-containing protein [Humisphaera borealis]